MNKRILVIDDEPGITRMVKLNLEHTGRYEVRTENESTKAIQTVREFQPDLILLDLMMPGMLGSTIAARLEEDADLRHIKFIFLTAVMSKDEERATQGRIGEHRFIAKPVGADELCDAVDEHLAQ